MRTPAGPLPFPAVVDDIGPGSGVTQRDLFNAIDGLRQEVRAAQAEQTATLQASISASESRIEAHMTERIGVVHGRMDEATKDRTSLREAVNRHEQYFAELRGARTLLMAVLGTSVLSAIVGIAALVAH